MSILQLAHCLAVLFLSLQQVLVPLLVEFLILLDVRLLTLLALLSLIEDKLLRTTIKVLLLQFFNTIFGHLSLDVLAFALTGDAVVFQDFAVKVSEDLPAKRDENENLYLHEVLNVVSVRFLLVELLLAVSVVISLHLRLWV